MKALLKAEQALLPTQSAQASEDGTISLDDKFTLGRGRTFMMGARAIVCLPMLRRQRDL